MLGCGARWPAPPSLTHTLFGGVVAPSAGAQDVAIIAVEPWLAYGCSLGARVNIRNLGASHGQCATVDRILGDDRVVAKVDGFSKADGVKGEVIVDLQPKTVIPTAGPGYPRGQRLLLLHKQTLVDATVMNWEGAVDFQQVRGARANAPSKRPEQTLQAHEPQKRAPGAQSP